jgi:hypothetical protein
MSTTEKTKVTAPLVKLPQVAAEPVVISDHKSALAADKIFSSGSKDNNGALLGVPGAKFVENKPTPKLDEKGNLVVKYDANGNPVAPKEQVVLPQDPTRKSGAGDSYNEMAKKLEAQRQAESAAAQEREAVRLKTIIVEEIRKGNTATHLHDDLAKLNRDVFNLPANHTGY